jgi:ketosteroid isomerase-like protein
LPTRVATIGRDGAGWILLSVASANAQLVERLIDAWNRRDLEAMLALTDLEAVYVNAPEAVEPGTRRGREELSRVMRKQWEGLGPEARQHIDRLHDRGEEVISENRVSRLLPGSADPLENRVAVRWVFRDGLLIHLEVLGGGSRFEEALRSAGLRG